ncbi:peptide MFS transporter [Moraxella porci]|uniref:peptide MFS transporter n=1 Tax=Moraxella porci TaxID=1288392 RepID=UPI00244A09C3|nr:oligopeptide:H+ symporter [Moraxella porci]MDH2272796.1 oligopeptide:H+ symporter [Moraxella porci]
MQEKQFFGHPKQLGSLFHLELWERFSYYGMQAILMIYLYYSLTEGGLGIDKGVAGGIVGAYSGSVYLSTLIGGWFADRVLGAERTLFYSGIVIMIGHILLAIVPGLQGLILGLVFVALGSGGVKAPVSAMVGSLYENDKYRSLRDAGFSIFYIAINIGGLLGPLLVGYLQSRVGFHYGFGAAAVGMALGLVLYSFGRKDLGQKTPPNPLTASDKTKALIGLVIGVVAVSALVVSDVLTLSNFKMMLFGAVIVIATIYFIRLLSDSRVTGDQKRHILAYIPLFVCICVFWALFFQNYTLLVVFFDTQVDRMLGGFEFPVGWQPSMQSFWVIALAGVMSALWTKLGNKSPSTPVKFSLSLLITAITFAFYLPYLKSGDAMPILVYLFSLAAMTVAELLISPISLSFATKIAPDFFKTQMVALNFLALSIGMTFGGILFGEYFNEANPIDYYYMMIYLGIGAGVVFLLISPMLKKMLQKVD